MSIRSQGVLASSTSGSGPTMHSTLCMPLARLSNRRRSRHIHRNRRRSGSLCRLCILRSLCLRNLWRLRSHDNHRILARAAHRSRRFHCQ